jgi:hypothetical protein
MDPAIMIFIDSRLNATAEKDLRTIPMARMNP